MNPIFRNLFFAVVAFEGVAASAQNAPSQAGAVKSEATIAGATSPPVVGDGAASAVDVKETPKAVPHFEEAGVFLGGNGGMNLASSKLSSVSGFSASLPMTWGQTFGGVLGWRPKHEGTDYRLRYDQRNATFTGLNGLNPTELTTKWRFLSLEVSSKIGKRLRLLGGFEYEMRTTDVDTTPYSAMTNLNLLGLKTGLRYSAMLSKQFYFDSELTFLLPVYIDETPQRTGSYRLGYRAMAEAFFGHRVNPYIDFRVGVKASQKLHKFSGTGTRGLQNGTESELVFSFPAELRFYF